MRLWDVEELAAMILAKGDEDKAEEILEEGDIEQRMYDQLDMDFDTFYKTVELLLPYTYPLRSPVTDELVHAFGVSEGDTFRAIVKEKM